MKDKASSTDSKYTLSSYFEGIESGHAVGWALLKEQPSKRLKIDIFCENLLVASGFANERREDLAEVNQSDGFHLFRLPLSDELYDNGAHTLTATISGTNILLAGGPCSTGRLTRKREFPIMSRAEGLEILNNILSNSSDGALRKQQHQYNLAYNLGSLLQETGLYTDSEATWSVFEKTLGVSSFLCYKRGEARLLQDDIIGAKEYFLEAIKLEPTFPWGHIGLANCLLQSSQFRDAENYYKQARNCKPEPEALKNFATNFADMQLIAEAEKLLSNKKTEEASVLLRASLLKEPHSAAIERKYNETLCLLHSPAEPHLDIVLKAKTKAKLLQHKISAAEEIIANNYTQSVKNKRSTAKDRK